MRISDWSSDVCSSDLISNNARLALAQDAVFAPAGNALGVAEGTIVCRSSLTSPDNGCVPFNRIGIGTASQEGLDYVLGNPFRNQKFQQDVFAANLSFDAFELPAGPVRSEEHTSELQSLMRISYAVFCLKKKRNKLNKKIHK